LKFRRKLQSLSTWSRSLHGERGLKLLGLDAIHHRLQVAPFTGSVD